MNRDFLGILSSHNGTLVAGRPFFRNAPVKENPEGHAVIIGPSRGARRKNTFLPTVALTEDSFIALDWGGALWNETAEKQKRQIFTTKKVLKFDPACGDGSCARWNPLAEVRIGTGYEMTDVDTIVREFLRVDSTNHFMRYGAADIFRASILHLLYRAKRFGNAAPCLSDVISFIATIDDEIFDDMAKSSHISKKEFLEEEMTDASGTPILDSSGHPKHYKNPLKEVYGEYIQDFRPFSNALGFPVSSIEEIRLAILKRQQMGETIDFQEEESDPDHKNLGLATETPWFRLLTHPKVAECIRAVACDYDWRSSIFQHAAASGLRCYQNPIVRRNTSASDFSIRDLLSQETCFALYFIVETKYSEEMMPFARVFFSMLANRIAEDMEYLPQKQAAKHILLLMDDFYRLGKISSLESLIFGREASRISVCLGFQSIKSVRKVYDDSFLSECRTHIYISPSSVDMETGEFMLRRLRENGENYSMKKLHKCPRNIVLLSSEAKSPKICKRYAYESNAGAAPIISDVMTKTNDCDELFLEGDDDFLRQTHKKNIFFERLKQCGTTLERHLKKKEKQENECLQKIEEWESWKQKKLDEKKDAFYVHRWSESRPNRPRHLFPLRANEDQVTADNRQGASTDEITSVQDALDSFKPRKPVRPEEPSEEETLRSSAVNADEDSFEGEEPDFFDEEPIKASPEVSEEEAKTEGTPGTDAQDPSNWEVGDLFSKMVTNKKKVDEENKHSTDDSCAGQRKKVDVGDATILHGKEPCAEENLSKSTPSASKRAGEQ